MIIEDLYIYLDSGCNPYIYLDSVFNPYIYLDDN